MDVHVARRMLDLMCYISHITLFMSQARHHNVLHFLVKSTAVKSVDEKIVSAVKRSEAW